MSAHRIRKGLDLPLAGAPQQVIEDAPPVGCVALMAADTPGLRPQFEVAVGDRVRRGQPLLIDRRCPGVPHVAPADGTVRAIHRGERRAFVSLVIDVAEGDGSAPDDLGPLPADPSRADPAELRALMLRTGLWTAWRTRPFSAVPAADAVPQATFVTALDTAPHAPDPQVVLAGREPAWRLGLQALARLAAPAPLLLCTAPGSALGREVPAAVQVHEFDGPHPAGTPGVHIHTLRPVGPEASVWHIGYQDVAALGQLLGSGRLDVTRVVALAGPAVRRPRLLRTRLGACISDIVAGELHDGEARVIAGSVLDGRAVGGEPTAHLGRHHRQVSALFEGREREFFGWIAPQRDKYSLWAVVAGHFARRERGLPLTTTTNGGDRAMVPIGSYERVMPMDIMATHLLRALVVGDVEQAVALGALELDEEDLALATFVCPGKTEYGPLLRRVLERVEKEGV